MKCYCYETETEFIFCVEDAEGAIYENLQSDQFWTKTDDDKFIKVYPIENNDDDEWYNDKAYKELIKKNFAQLGKSWIEGIFDWKKVLFFIVRKFAENEIEWYILGSVSEATLGVSIIPHDIDIAVHTKDFYKVKDLLKEYVIEPFVDNKGAWLVRYFGKLCIDGASVDICADNKMNFENNFKNYEKVSWNNYDIFITPLKLRYETEIQRGRTDRVKAIEKYMNCH